jgi:large subunit ribosomal protein L2
MKLKQLNPTTSGTRFQINIQKNLLSKTNKLFKSSIKGIKRFFGRSLTNGRITVWHKGGACKKKVRQLASTDTNYIGIVLTVMYDPFRNSFIALVFDFKTSLFFNILSTAKVLPGSIVLTTNKKSDLNLGYRILLQNTPTGSIFHSLSLNNNIKYARSAGTSCQLIQKLANNCKVKLPSGVVVDVNTNSFGTLGSISNSQHNLISIGKAGKNRLKGIRPTVRGIAMNPVDHPHGGRTNGGRPSVTPWGIPTKGKPTVKKK